MASNGDRRTMDDRDRRSVEERRTQLVDSATEVIASEGLGRATTRRITDHADLALGAFHYAFRSKDELLQAVIARIADQMETVLRESVTDPSTGIDGVVAQMVAGYWEFVERSPGMHLAQAELTVHALRDPKLRELASRQYDGYVEVVQDILRRAHDAPPREGLADLARFLLATMDGLVLQRLLHGDAAAADRRVQLYMRCLGSVSSTAAAS